MESEGQHYRHVRIYLVLTWAPVGPTGKGKKEGNTHLSSNYSPGFCEGTSEMETKPLEAHSPVRYEPHSYSRDSGGGGGPHASPCYRLVQRMHRFTNSGVLLLFRTTLPQDVRQLLSFPPPNTPHAGYLCMC